MLLIYFHGNDNRYNKYSYILIEQILSSKIIFLNIVTTVSYACSSVMNKCLQAVLMKICSVEVTHSWNVPAHCLAVLTSTAWSPEVCSEHSNGVGGCHFVHVVDILATIIIPIS